VPSCVVLIRAMFKVLLYAHARKPKLPSKGAAYDNGTIAAMTMGRNFILTDFVYPSLSLRENMTLYYDIVWRL